ncbi:hypothetical protein ACFX59_02370 [Sphingomonas sp. NCPPB 2930]|uniref:hypothetical protein n=1 Tax=Sphingomonas sp. NCPPB 2930 TaxID=3162788 RepID=UPI0036DF0CD2
MTDNPSLSDLSPPDAAEKVDGVVTIALTIADLFYKIIAAAIATAVVAYAADKTHSILLWFIVAVLSLIVAIYSVLIPFKVAFPFRNKVKSGGRKLKVMSTIALFAVATFTIAMFQQLPDMVKYMNDAAHPAIAEVSIQH